MTFTCLQVLGRASDVDLLGEAKSTQREVIEFGLLLEMCSKVQYSHTSFGNVEPTRHNDVAKVKKRSWQKQKLWGGGALAEKKVASRQAVLR
jgi:hypothetical protein